jgi:hypothetical protein
MATACLPMRPTFRQMPWPRLLPGERESAAAGPEGRTLAKLLDKLRAHVTESAEALAALNATDEDLGYVPVSPISRFRMSVNVRMRGRGHAMPYHLDDFED